MSLSGGTVTNTITISNTTDASGTSDNKPALIIGGTSTQAHIEIDNNELMAKNNATTPADLYINNEGGVVRVNNERVVTSESIAGGNVRFGDIGPNSSVVLNIVYSETYKNIPSVVATINHSYTDILKVSVYNCTKTGFTMRVYNTGNVTASSVNVNWLGFDYLTW